MRKVIFFILLFAITFLSEAHEYRNILQQKTTIAELKNLLFLNQEWVQYPKYTDREGWDMLSGDFKDEIIQSGEEALEYEWKVIKATDYLEFGRSGSRQTMEDPFGANNMALTNLVLAELTEGKGRFIDQIINGVWHTCEMTSWGLSAVVGLPSCKENIIDLTTGDLGSFLAWTYYFLKNEFDKVNPLVAERLRENIQRRILDPYMIRDDFWWQAFNASPATMVNNWNPWCNFNVLSCFLLLEDDHDKLAAAVYRTMISVDKYLNYVKEDGACEEGPSYWGLAAGKLYDYLQLLNAATAEKISVFDLPMIRNMGEYIVNSYVGNGWVVNFADASAKGGGDKGLIFRYGKAVQSTKMQQFAAWLYEQDKRPYYYAGRDIYRTLENLYYHNELANTQPALFRENSIWYSQTQFCYMRNKTGFFFAVKGGHNNESHNHNDVGSFILYSNQTPMIIDAGVGTYTRQTFSHERYNIWTMQSNYHNLPAVNGVTQAPGAQYHAEEVLFNPKKMWFSLDLAKAYPDEAAVEKWERSYLLESKGGLTIQDKFSLGETKKPNQLNFITWAKPDISVPGTIILEKDGIRLKMTYDAGQFNPDTEIIPLTDIRLSNVWGKQIYRLSLNASKMQLSGIYRLTIDRP
ncbi:MAG: heparinase [Bacteroidetes bacterium GWF2_42_66]|nr:MAG: heparinase [Bacteroidetes bacterium GWA2_42_15]OFY02878.1 MAG: heparinase [Bacteroidetes bacterium GWE2_42_39]OFY44533.1 MAG: heparinase [Bacteroidetes bacterium GWF2_42_66]HBL74916.1 heparinase [Prolixibacteraceae bacterium]HCR88953.1 heparinase [Prolixibacteraceae bacterium]